MATWVEKWKTVGSASTYTAAAVTGESAKASTTTKPVTDESTGRYIIDVSDELGKASLAALALIGTDNANETFNARLWGWTQVYPDGSWVPNYLGDISTITLGSKTVAIGGVTYQLPDTLTASPDYTYNASIEVIGASSAGNGFATVTIDPSGHELLEVEMSRNGATAASMWLMYRRMSR